jgi:nicotinamide-nucleotide amidase
VRGRDAEDVARRLAPLQDEVRRRLGNFILAEDDRTLEGVLVDELARAGASLAMVETFSAGQMAARIAHLPGAEALFRRGVVARTPAALGAALGLPLDGFGLDAAQRCAETIRDQSGASHALAMLVDLDEGADRIDLGGTLAIAIAAPGGVARRAARILGGREWVRLGAIEMGLDCLRRFLQGLPVDERIDFEKR